MKESKLFQIVMRKAEQTSERNFVDAIRFVYSSLYYATRLDEITEVDDKELENSLKVIKDNLGSINVAYVFFDNEKKAKVNRFDVKRFTKILNDVKGKFDEVTLDCVLEKVFENASGSFLELINTVNYLVGEDSDEDKNEEVDLDEDTEDVDKDVDDKYFKKLFDSLRRAKEEKEETDEEELSLDGESSREEKRDDAEFAERVNLLDEKLEQYSSGKKPKKSVSDANLGSAGLVELIKKVKNAQKYLLENVYGQDDAVNTLISGYYQAEVASISKKSNKPKAVFLFAGPPGVGKTFLSEQTAKILGLPYRRFDMSEYSDKEANFMFCGSDSVYKGSSEGNVTGFVAKNPECVLLFDEIEKAHLNVIHLFLQMLDAGRLRDNYTNVEVSFNKTIIFLTTNAGKNLYEDEIENLSAIPRKRVLNALSEDINPVTHEPSFPKAVCSRLSGGNVVMFNKLLAHELTRITREELFRTKEAFSKQTGININIDEKVVYALLFGEGGNVDARTAHGRASNFFYQETFELFRLMTSEERNYDLSKLKTVDIVVDTPTDGKTKTLFDDGTKNDVLIFSGAETGNYCKELLKGVNVYCADDAKNAEEILFDHDISLILCDLEWQVSGGDRLLNLEDISSFGMDFFEYAKRETRVPVYVLQTSGKVTREEELSLMRKGARGVIQLSDATKDDFSKKVLDNCAIINQQNKLLELAKANKVLTFKTKQEISDDEEKATITLFDFKLEVAPDVEEGKALVSDVSKPNVKFDDVIGAEDAKDELKYFVNYFKNSKEFMRKGVRAPKGILLYGPPGTGKTLLAKAMAGESDVSFIAMEGNDFLKKFIGEGPEKVHEMFKLARKYAPSILFIDEIDAIGKARSNDVTGASNAADVLTAFLTEMDGFKTQPDKPVFVLGATNFDANSKSSNGLDAAFLRRFDRKILVDLPSKAERERFIRLKSSKAKNVVLSDELIENIATRSTDMSLSDLDSVFELALRDSIKAKDCEVDDECFENAFESYNGGEIKKWDAELLERTARHEAGHALACYLSGETPSYLTVVARGNYGGYMQHADDEGKALYTKEELLSRVRTALAGRACEIVFYGESDGVSTGAAGDLQTATQLVEQMICLYGMDEKTGLSTIDLRGADSSCRSLVRERVNEILSEEFKNIRWLIFENVEAINALVKELLEKTHLNGKDIERILSCTVKIYNEQNA